MSETTRESPVFTRTHDLLRWLVPATRKFPRDQRFALAERLMAQAFALEDALVAAAVDRRHLVERLLGADIALKGLRRSLLLCHELTLLSDGQYRHASGLTAEVGRFLGGWQKRCEEPGAQKAARPKG